MIKDACEARDRANSLLLDGDVDAALEVAQALTVLGSEEEFECFLTQFLEDALSNELHSAGDYSDYRGAPHPMTLTSDQQARVCNAVSELRETRRYNNAVLAVLVC